MADIIPIQKQCQYCGRMKDTQKDFYPNYSPFHPYNKMFFCKDCSKEIEKAIFDRNENFEVCTRNLCATFDMPYLKGAQEKLDIISEHGKTSRNISYVYNYLNALMELDTPIEYWNDLSGMTYIGFDILKVAKPTSDGDIELLQSLEQNWGNLQSLSDYAFCEERFYKYTAGQELSPAALNTVRYLCLAELEVKQLKARGEDSKAAEDKVMKYYKSLKLDNFSISGDKPLYQTMIEDWATIEETKNPIQWVDENMEDICGFRKDYDQIMRCVGNYALGNKNYPDLTVEDIKVDKKKKGGIDK